MSHRKLFSTWFLSLFLIISISLLNVNTAFADDGPPPEATSTSEPTEEPAEPPVESVETQAAETPTPEETPVSAEATPAAEETAPVEEQGSASEEAPTPGLLSQLPDETQLLVFDESGEVIPLVSEDAIDAILETDPMWCPANTPPGGSGCRSFTGSNGIANLLQDMRNNTNLYDADGIIYFTANPGNGSFTLTTAGSSLGNGDFNTLNDFDLTLQGGWNGSTANPTYITQTNFGSNSITIGTSSNPWAGNITLINFTFSGASGSSAVTVYTTGGDITLNNVDVAQQGGENYTALLDSNSGDITVQNDSSFDGNNNGNNENRGFHAETNTGTITIANTTFTDARGCSSLFGFCLLETTENYNGATLSAPIVSLTNVTANNNDLNGIEISNANTVTLNNVTATNNGTNMLLQPDSGDVGAGVDVNGAGSTLVSVMGGNFSNNERYGIEVSNGSILVLSYPTCTGNDLGCTNDSVPPTLSLPGNITTEATGPSGAVVAYSASANDNVDGARLVTCNPASTSTFPIGTTTVNCSASDTRGNTANGSFTVTVQDTLAPTLTLPANITTEATGPTGAVVTYAASATDTVDGSRPVNCSPASGSTFPSGATTIACSAADTGGNTSNGSFTVTVQDTIAPTLSLPADIADEATGASGAAVTYSASANDLVDGSRPVSCSAVSGSTFAIGTTTVSCSASDTSGNTANDSFNITIQDTTAPVIAPVADMAVKTKTKAGAIVTYPLPGTTDIVDGPGTASCILSSGNLFPVGDTLVTCSATDSEGNGAAPVTFVVQVVYKPETVLAPVGFAGLIPVTGGELINLSCLTTVNAFNIKVTFFNLCGHQSIMNSIDATSLPHELPDGVSFVKGLDVIVLKNNELVKALPDGTGVEMDIPILAGTQDQFAVLYWDDEDGDGNGEWVEISQQIAADKISQVMGAEAEDELYQITGAGDQYFKTITTDETGIFVLVKK